MKPNLDIKTLRERLGITQKALADSVGVQPNTVARWERGELGISPTMMDRLEEVANSCRSTTVRRSSAAMLDQHHRAILDALDGQLDPVVFEACAAALLRHEWPTLVSVRGGGDDGFDGAIAAHAGEPFPLIATTGVRHVDNLTRNLERAKSRGWTITSALFATPRRITPRSRIKLFDAARTRGVTLHQAYDQDWFARSLYQKPDWCKRLLGVTGRPAALSLFPVTPRPLLGDSVLGRERELGWLREQKGDCLLVGEPGSGKTFLLRTLALEGRARFLVDHDRTQIANDLRSLRPAAVIVDDAHVDPMQIEKLDQIRREVGAQFRIIATSWPGDAPTVRSTLGVGSNQKLQLNRIDADTMVEIIKSFGIHGPDRLLYVIRKQAAGRPGLAATLAHLCRSGNVLDVVSGESLFDELSRSIGQVMDSDARLLAPFALGGDAGVKKVAVSNHLGKSLFDVNSCLAKIGAAGVIRERSDEAISVEPEPMRWIIVRRAFFDGPGALDVASFLEIVETRRDALRTLIGARSRGAAIADLERWLEEANLPEIWSDYASLGAAEARYVLRRHPELIEAVAHPTLHNAPEMAISMLLDRMVDERFVRSTDHPLDELKFWANGAPDEVGYLLERRLTLVRETHNWWKRTRNGQPAVHALRLALMPGLTCHISDPGIGNTFSHMSRALGDDELQALASQWPKVRKIVRESERVPWSDLFELAQVWIEPQLEFFPPVNYGKATRDAMRDFARTMLVDIASVTRHHPGIQHRIAELAERVKITVELNLDPEFEMLVPPRSSACKDWQHREQAWSDAIDELVGRWEHRPFEEVASLLERFEFEARLAGMEPPMLMHGFCAALAERVSDPVAAADALIRRSIPSGLVAPFVCRAATDDRPGWTRLAGRCLAKDEYRWIAVEPVLVHRSPPRDLFDTALSAASEMPSLEDFMHRSCRRLPDAAIRDILQSNVRRLAVATSIGYWLEHREGIPDAIRTPWRQAILRSAPGGAVGHSDDYWLGVILSEDRGLAVDWLVSGLTDAEHSGYCGASDLVKTVTGSLGLEHRKNVLDRLAAADEIRASFDVMRLLVGGDLDLYHRLLNSKTLKKHHLDPLDRASNLRESETTVPLLDGAWRRMALAALDHGYSTQEVLEATNGRVWFWSGAESDMWAKRRRGFEALLNDADDRIVRIGRDGVEYTMKSERYAIHRETEEAVEGLQ